MSLVDPDMPQLSFCEVARRKLVAMPLSEADADWLSALLGDQAWLLKVSGVNESTDIDAVYEPCLTNSLSALGNWLREASNDRDVALTRFLASIMRSDVAFLDAFQKRPDDRLLMREMRKGDDSLPPPSAEVQRFLKAGIVNGVNFRRGLRTLCELRLSTGAVWVTQVAAMLYREGILSPEELIDPDALAVRGQNESWVEVESIVSDMKEQALFREDGPFCRRLLFWLHLAGPAALTACRTFLESGDADRTAQIAHGIWKEMSCFLMGRRYDQSHFLTLQGPWRAYDEVFRELFFVLHRRFSAASDHPVLRQAMWRFAWRGSHGERVWIDEPARRSLVSGATEFWGKLRPILRSAHENPIAAAVAFPGPESATDSIYVLAVFAGPWSAMKALLLAMRALSVPAVGIDLRFWKEGANEVPQPWSRIPEMFAIATHYFAGMMRERDRDLMELRTDFAEFCLDRLKLKAGVNDGGPFHDVDMQEANAIWRRCFVHAIRELRVNPGQRGHRTLYWASQNDPSPEVRTDALQTYNEIRHHVALQEGRSGFAAVFAAFWWLRQAHMLALGQTIDGDGARRTRAKELRRAHDLEGMHKKQ